MKTILIAHNYTQDSFAFMSYSLAHYLAKKGNRVVFISHKPFFRNSFSENFSQGELIIYSWPTEKRPTRLSDALWFIDIYRKYKPHTVISHFVNVNITISVSKVMSFGKVRTLPYYHTLSSQIEIDTKKNKCRNFLNKLRKMALYNFFCDGVICPSDLAVKDLSEHFRIKKGIKVLNPMEDRFVYKEKISSDQLQIVYLGRIDNSKGVIEMIEAFNVFCLRYPDTRIKIKIAGSGSQKMEMKEMIRRNDRINYVGALSYSHVDSYLNKAHYTIIPSKFDNLPTVGLESLMNQTPLLISNTTGLSDELKDGFECYKFNSNTNSMIQLFERVENNFHLQEQMSINARRTFLEKFNIESYFQSIENLI